MPSDPKYYKNIDTELLKKSMKDEREALARVVGEGLMRDVLMKCVTIQSVWDELSRRGEEEIASNIFKGIS